MHNVILGWRENTKREVRSCFQKGASWKGKQMEMSLLNIMMRDERSLIQKSSKGVKCKLFRKEANETGCDKVSDE